MGILGWILTLAVLGGIGYGAYWYYTEFLSGDSSSNGLFRGGREKRLGVLEQTSVDGRRKLVLIRRDDVEHLIMTGGPVDVVVETGILPQSAAGAVASSPIETHDSGDETFDKSSRRVAQSFER